MKERSHCLASTCSEIPARKRLRHALGNAILPTRCLLQNQILKNNEHLLFFLPSTNINILENNMLGAAPTANAPRAEAAVSHSATYRDLLKTLCRTEQSAAIRKATNLQTALSSGLLPSVRLNSDLMQTGAQLLAVVTLGLRSSSANFSPVREKCFWFCERIPCVKVYKIHPFYSREVHIKVWSVSTVLDEFSFQSESPMTERKTSKCFQKSKKTLITGFRIVSPWLPDVEI